MKKSYLVLCVLCLVSVGITSAQVPLKIGDQLPDLAFGHVRHYKADILRLKDLRGKLVILDFWDIYCHSCIEAMPKMEALQKQFGDKIQVILVTNNTFAQVETLFSHAPVARNCGLPSIIGDTVLTRLFPFRTVPTHVWIDERGHISQFTGPFTNVSTIQSYLSGALVKLPLKHEYTDFDTRVPLFKEGNGRQLTHLKYYSALFDKIDDDGASKSTVVDSLENTYTITYRNMPLTALYQAAYTKKGFPTDPYNSRVVVSNGDTAILHYPPLTEPEVFDQWVKDYVRSYELRLPLHKRQEAQAVLKKDLDQYVGWEAKLETRLVKCWVLSCVDSLLLSASTGGVRSMEVVSFFASLKFRVIELTGIPVISELNYAGRINMALPEQFENTEEIIALLRKTGLELRKEERPLQMLILHPNP